MISLTVAQSGMALCGGENATLMYPASRRSLSRSISDGLENCIGNRDARIWVKSAYAKLHLPIQGEIGRHAVARASTWIGASLYPVHPSGPEDTLIGASYRFHVRHRPQPVRCRRRRRKEGTHEGFHPRGLQPMLSQP